MADDRLRVKFSGRLLLLLLLLFCCCATFSLLYFTCLAFPTRVDGERKLRKKRRRRRKRERQKEKRGIENSFFSFSFSSSLCVLFEKNSCVYLISFISVPSICAP